MNFEILDDLLILWNKLSAGALAVVDVLFKTFGELLEEISPNINVGILPDVFVNATLIELLFGTGLTLFIAVTLVKWVIGIFT